MPYTTYKNKKVFYQITGRGYPLLLLHGNTVSSRTFGGTIKFFSRYFKVITFDYPGHGRSEKVPELAEDFWYEMSRVALGILNNSGIDKTNIIGTSGGSVVALNLALENPEKVNRVVADSTIDTLITREMADSLVAKREIMSKGSFGFVWWLLHGMKWRHLVKTDNEVFMKFAASGKHIYHKDLSEVKSEVIFAASKGDTLTENAVEIAEKISAKNPKFSKYIFDSGEHITLLSNKHEFRRMALDFFRSNITLKSCPSK